VEAVALGPNRLVAGIRPGSVYVDLTTSSPALIRRIYAAFDEKGAQVLDAPLSGGREELLHGKQEAAVGGDYAAFRRVRPVLAAFCDQIIHAGAIGAGTVCKLVHNLLMRDLNQAIAEGMTLWVQAGVQAEELWKAIRRGLFGKQMLLHIALPQTAFRGDYDSPTYTLALAHKDVMLAIELARDFGVPLPMSNVAAQVNVHAMSRGWGTKDNSVSFVLQEEAAGVEVRAPDIDLERAARYLTTHPDQAERER
jgi:3-hydroxyisobutyrate dehydrogenase